MARDLLAAKEEDGVFERIEWSDGSFEKYGFKNNVIVGTTADGNIRTCFKPVDFEAYWRGEHDRNK